MADVITKFKLETTQYDSKLRDATDRMKELMRSVQVAGGSLNDLSAKDKELARSFGTLATGANNTKDKVRELTNDFNKMARQYNAMTAEMQKSDVGRMIAGQMQVMRERLSEAKKELYEVGEAEKTAAEEGIDFGSVLQSLGSQLGINTSLLSSLTTGTIATTAAVAAGVTAVVAATKAWTDYNDELNRQNTITTVVTGLKGNAGEELTVGVRALARTYDVDFRQAIEAANTLIQQFGVSGEEALSLLQDGMQGMIMGDGGKLLSMIQQYAPSFRDAGIAASELVAIIQNSEGGLFTDQNMSAITMGIKNIRLMTTQTSEALAQLGVDGEEMTRKLNDGSMTIFEAMQEVTTAIENAGGSSQAVGQVMQQVFGRQGAMAGTKLGEAIATLNTNLEETKGQTGELGESFVKLNEANLRLEQTMQDIFGMTGWEDMNNLLKTDLANTLSDVLTFMGDIKTSITEIGTSQGFNALCDVLDTLVIPKLMGVTTALKGIKGWLDGLAGGGSYNSNDYSNVWGDFIDRITGNTLKKQTKSQPTQEVKSQPTQEVKSSGWQWGQGWQPEMPSGKSNLAQPIQTPPPPQYSYKVTKDKLGNVLKEVRVEGGVETVLTKVKQDADTASVSIDGLKDKLKELRSERDKAANAGNTTLRDTYNKQIKETQDKIKELQGTATTPKTTTTKKDTWKAVEMKPVETIDFTKRSIKDVLADTSRATRSYNEAGDEMGRAAAKAMIDALKAEEDAILNEGDVTKGGYADAYTHDFGKDIKKLENRTSKNDADDRKNEVSISKEIGEMAGGIQSMAVGLENLGVVLPEGLNNMLGGIMSVIQILQGISTIVAAIQVISAADTFIPFAHGGIVPKAANGMVVPGNSYSGDRLRMPVLDTGGMIGVNSGELILNAAQSDRVANMLMSRQGGGMIEAQPYTTGELMFLGLNNTTRRQGKGEIVTTSMLKARGLW